MKKRMAIIITVISFTLSSYLHAGNFTDDESYKDDYSWELTNSDQKKVACGMVMWGFFLAIASALISAFIPNSTSDTSTTPPSPSPII